MKEEVKSIILNLPNLSFAYLFGSRANGTFKENSDYDICIVIKDDDKQIVFKTVTEFMLKHSEFIQPLVLTKQEFDEKMKISIYKTKILDKGILLSRA
jgi:predicted nucleotidyltransferase